MPILRILRIKIKMEVPFLYMKFWTNHYNNKMCPKFMYKNRTFYSHLVFIFSKSRQTVQTALQTTAENHVCNWDGRYSQWLFWTIICNYLQLIHNNTLHTWTPRNIMGGICKKNQQLIHYYL